MILYKFAGNFSERVQWQKTIVSTVSERHTLSLTSTFPVRIVCVSRETLSCCFITHTCFVCVRVRCILTNPIIAPIGNVFITIIVCLATFINCINCIRTPTASTTPSKWNPSSIEFNLVVYLPTAVVIVIQRISTCVMGDELSKADQPTWLNCRSCRLCFICSYRGCKRTSR